MHMLKTRLVILLLIVLHATINLMGAALIKDQVNRSRPNVLPEYLSMMLSWRALAGFGLIGVGFLIMMVIMRRTDFAFFMPVSLSVSYVITITIAVFFLGETIEARTYLGIALMMLGSLFLLKQP